ncbi:MAG TPA: BTAD domain-containing putative transcriptional regulator [Acidimicrobiales bacterium]
MEIRLLGPLEVVGGDGEPAPVAGARLRALLARLAVAAGRVVPAEVLLEDLWDGEPAPSVNALHVLVAKLRRRVGRRLVVTREPGYALAIEPEAVDAHRFERLVAEGRSSLGAADPATADALLSRALDLWRGLPLADFVYEDWAQADITRLTELQAGAAEDRIDAALQLARHAEVVGEIEALIARYPLRERLRGHLMLALYRAGRQADALRAYQDARTHLSDELGLEPGAELQHLEARILAHDPSLEPPVGTVAPGPERPPAGTRVRAPLGRTIGRATELAELAGLIDRHRLVTIVGPGGVGKTRLAVEAARRLDTLAGRVWLVELGAVAAEAEGEVGRVLAAALGIGEPAARPVERVVERVGDTEGLIVLDNCEHVIDAAARLSVELLTACPRIRILATSREALAVPGETVWSAPPLAIDDAVALFFERAGQGAPRHSVDDAEQQLVAGICRRLDGLPLGIELAAARVGALSIDEIASRLDDRFRILTRGPRPALPQHQTLAAVVDWSYQLLSGDERRLFDRLSVFVDGFGLEAVEDVCAGDDLARPQVADTLARLVERSLVEARPGRPATRYRLLQTLAAFGREHLAPAERGPLLARHGRYYGDLARRGEAALRGEGQRQWLENVGRDINDVRAAYGWAAAHDPRLAVDMTAGLAWYWWVSGGSEEGWQRSHQALRAGLRSEPDAVPASRWVLAIAWTAYLAVCAGRADETEPLVTAGRARLDRAGRTWQAAFARLMLARVEAERGWLHDALLALVDAAAFLDELPDDPWVRAARLWAAGELELHDGEVIAAADHLVAAADLLEAHGEAFFTTSCLFDAATAMEARGRYDHAAAALTRARDIAERLELATTRATFTARLGRIALLTDRPDAEALLGAAARDARELRFRPALAVALAGLAVIERDRGNIDTAEAHAREALDLHLTGVPAGVRRASVLTSLGHLAHQRGDLAAATDLHAQALGDARRGSDTRTVAAALDGLAGSAATRRQSRLAARLLGAADAQRTAAGMTTNRREQADRQHALDLAAAHLSPDELAAALAEGAAAPLDHTLAA